MKPEYRILILLYYIEEMTIQEVAEYLQLSKPAISQKLKRARKKLLEQFQRKWDIDDE
jgi:RNA polymerase sigma-70 factor (ECF subfamily)